MLSGFLVLDESSCMSFEKQREGKWFTIILETDKQVWVDYFNKCVDEVFGRQRTTFSLKDLYVINLLELKQVVAIFNKMEQQKFINFQLSIKEQSI
jgi:hypothetical protein